MPKISHGIRPCMNQSGSNGLHARVMWKLEGSARLMRLIDISPWFKSGNPQGTMCRICSTLNLQWKGQHISHSLQAAVFIFSSTVRLTS
ncbi:hypothetical protein AVEN_36539-1 [Araneus ventricosus]|uniref:Uncharacterized protein n=1 Tax=Araneus ventricosus TaxID=182803 RepID=A0A4Y2S2V9_ARAVE|nr:hypothetical protein AVEN_36539-1 [Araneus ventricosus]